MKDIDYYFGRHTDPQSAAKAKSRVDLIILKSLQTARVKLKIRGWDKNAWGQAYLSEITPCRLTELIARCFEEHSSLIDKDINKKALQQAYAILNNSALEISRPTGSRKWKDINDWESRRRYDSLLEILDSAIDRATKTYIQQ